MFYLYSCTQNTKITQSVIHYSDSLISGWFLVAGKMTSEMWMRKGDGCEQQKCNLPSAVNVNCLDAITDC